MLQKVNSIGGGNAVGFNTTVAIQLTSTCTSTSIIEDKSVYLVIDPLRIFGRDLS